jgi:hypothetical protein
MEVGVYLKFGEYEQVLTLRSLYSGMFQQRASAGSLLVVLHCSKKIRRTTFCHGSHLSSRSN